MVALPCLKYHIDALKGVQRRFTKKLPGLFELTYAERLSNLNLQTLGHRRLITDLTTVFNIVHGFTSLCFDDFFSFTSNPSSRGHSLRLSVPLVKNNTRKFFFSTRVINSWNSHPDRIVTSSTTLSFKNQIISLDLSQYLNFACIIRN